ncbi:MULTISPECIES: hypothetical protein [Streptosporangium]|uniref:WXG100 family type VII secretion target n=1 Tax=Streptosporangium brasiliense TaxID=47480 RepID=A0ABT9R892_9ACTN|nr:hypothetical protein [Streptosporangium brasiliense]MDP9865464.1 hypothetical protein [Streptosporangium brasiliense]
MPVPPGKKPSPLTAGKSARGVLVNSTKVLSNLEKGARLAPTLWAGVAIATTAVANVPGMADIYNNWDSIHARLDTANKSYAAALLNKHKDGWIAEDRDAFDDAVQRYQEALESLRAYIKTIAGIVDELGDSYRAYWLAIAKVAGTLLFLASIAAAMLATPYAGNAALNLRMLGVMASKVIAASTAALGKVVAAGASSMSIYFSGKAWLQAFNLEPTESAKIDFTQAKINIKGLAPFQEPPVQKPGQQPQLPPHAGFEWLSPKKELPEKYK